jgi:transcriptional regulator GlxA family with amidase domain
LRVAILAFDDVEALDLAGPYEVFTTASRMQQRATPAGPPLFEVTCVARSRGPIRMRAGLCVLPGHGFDNAPNPDVLIVPGGVVDVAMQCSATLDWIARTSHAASITASVCTGAFLLAASHVLTNEQVTTHWEDIADLCNQFPSLDVRANVRWVDQGHIVTSAGITAGIDMSLHLVARLAGEPLAQRTARQMDFAWTRLD